MKPKPTYLHIPSLRGGVHTANDVAVTFSLKPDLIIKNSNENLYEVVNYARFENKTTKSIVCVPKLHLLCFHGIVSIWCWMRLSVL